jgi:hypothetical protein
VAAVCGAVAVVQRVGYRAIGRRRIIRRVGVEDVAPALRCWS